MRNAENIKGFAGIKSGKEYLLNGKKLLEDSQISFEFPKEIYTEEVDKVNFYVLEAKIKMGSLTVMQKYYSTINKDYALNIIITYSNEEELNPLE